MNVRIKAVVSQLNIITEHLTKIAEDIKEEPGTTPEKPDRDFWEGSRMRQLKLEIEKLIDSKLRRPV